jgi:hypothetical protein
MTIKFILENWYIILAFIAAGIAIGIAVYHFTKLPRADQLKKVREWLLWAVIQAEKALGSGTGQLKLRRVYDLFVARFPWLAKIIPFEMFCKMVDDALDEMRELLKNNPAVARYLAGENVLILDGIDVDDLDDDQLRAVLQQMGYAYTDGMTREQMLATLDEAVTE